jgi:hypothetical protein
MVGVDFSPRNEPAPMRHVVTPEPTSLHSHSTSVGRSYFGNSCPTSPPINPTSVGCCSSETLPDLPPINTQLQLGGRSSGTLPNRFQRFSRCLASCWFRVMPSKCLILRHAISAFAFSSSAQPRQVRLLTLAKFLLSRINNQILVSHVGRWCQIQCQTEVLREKRTELHSSALPPFCLLHPSRSPRWMPFDSPCSS